MQLLDKRDAADAIGIGSRSLDAWRQRGYGPRFLKVGGRIKYPPEEIDAFLQKCTRSPAGEDSGRSKS
jgi:hypothetical protein